MTTSRNYLHAEYDAVHDSPMQQKFRKIHPWPVGSVYIQRPGETLEDIRAHFRLMHELGFTSLKQCQLCRGTDRATVLHMAIDEGICPWWYGEGGWENPTKDKLESLGIDPDISIEALRENPTWIERQKQLWHDRVDFEQTSGGRKPLKPDEATDKAAKLVKQKSVDVPGVQPQFEYGISETHAPYFLNWLKSQYGTIENLNYAWNVHHCMIPGPSNAQETGGKVIGWSSWEHLAEDLPEKVNSERREYRRIRDVLRFHADNYLAWLRDRVDQSLENDPNAPVRAGGEMGLFLPFAWRGTDMEGIAELMKDRGSFYPSFHLSWHFEEVDFETVRPFYMQSSITTDWFKGGWNATWESTGGPQQMTGHKAPFVPKVSDKVPGFTVDEGIQTQLMLSWIAGGYRGFGIWCWSVRTAGWEGGEFGLLDRNNRVTERAKVAGQIGQTCRRLRDELWQTHKEPDVGIFQDWDMEAIWAASSRGGRDLFRSQPIRARIGAARAMINGNIPWEHVTGSDLKNGLAGRYRSIILPAALALDTELVESVLIPYVEAGGRLVLDAPGAWFDYNGTLLSTDDGSPFERLFGCRLADFQYSRPGNRPWVLRDELLDGCTFDIQPTQARVVESFADGKPAVTEHQLGAGTAVVMGFEASLSCCEPGHEMIEQLLREHTLGSDYQPSYICEDGIVYRLAAPTADHYFLMNDGEEKQVTLKTPGYQYSRGEDPISGEALEPGSSLTLPAYSARWVRMIK